MQQKTGIKPRAHYYGHHGNHFEPFRDKHISEHTQDLDSHHKRQHFIHGKGGGGSPSNRLIYGSQSVPYGLNDTNAKRKQTFYASQMPRPETYPSQGFLYGKEDTKVGMVNGGPKFNKLYEERSTAEIKKKIDQGREIEEDLQRHREEKLKRQAQRKEEQKQDLEMLKAYQPWGRPGGGAPNAHHENTGSRESDDVLVASDFNQTLPLGRPGGGAPNRTDSGRVQAALKSDPEVLFQSKKEGKNHHLLAEKLHLRENTDHRSYRTELEKLAEQSRSRRSWEREQDFRSEIQALQYNPFGKPGGGAPIKDNKGHLKAGLPVQLSNDIQKLREVENRHAHAFNDLREKNEEFDIDTFRHARGRENRNDKQNRTSVNDEMFLGRQKLGGAGAPRRDKDGNIVTQYAQTLVKNREGALAKSGHAVKSQDVDDEEGFTYHPWGKPGAGAPIRDDRGKLMTQVAGKVQAGQMEMESVDKDRKKEYLETLQQMAAKNETIKSKEKEERLQPTQPVATWLRQGKIGQPKYDPITREIKADPLTTSDITKTRLQIRQPRQDEAKEYYNELEKYEKIKRQDLEREKKQEREKSVEHAKTMERLWGRQGNGAPLSDHRKQKNELQPANFGMAYRGV